MISHLFSSNHERTEQPQSQRVVQTTPQRRGTASNTEYHSDARAKNPTNIINVDYDLEDTQKVEFHDILKMFIKRRELGDNLGFEDLDVLKQKVKERGTEFNKEFEHELQAAVNFCNKAPFLANKSEPKTDLDEEERCQKIKYYLAEYCSASNEKDRYVPLVIVLNHILRWMDEDPKFIFVVNDPTIVRLQGVPLAKRKPDIVLVKLETFKSWFQDCQYFDFKNCQTWIEKTWINDRPVLKKGVRPLWSDIIQFWELEYKKKLKVDPLWKKFVVVDNMIRCPPNQAQESSSVSAARNSDINQNRRSATNGKRKFEENNSVPKKRSRKRHHTSAPLPRPANSTSRHWTASGARAPPHEDVPAVSKDVQCVYYAIEGLRSSWNVSHVSGIFLQDSALNVLWYDAQGCLMSHPLDIVEHLPLLLVLIKVQVRSNYLSGFRDIDELEIYDSYKPGKFTGPFFQLTGRRTSYAFLTHQKPVIVNNSSDFSEMPRSDDKVPANNQDDKSSAVDEYFFKVSWPEDAREKEHDIIKLARNRAANLLDQYCNHVIHHLPDIKHSEVVPNTCTAIVRVLANCPTEATKGSRSQYRLISKKLQSLASVVHKFKEFKKIYMELIRCHRLLWMIGIAHGDISFSNLMYDEGSGGPRGILNDFDLAATMEPGDLSPSQTGFRRTGTKIFMAMRLLQQDALEGKVDRYYRHDLESFAWVLLYAWSCIDRDSGEERLDMGPINTWIQADHSVVQEKKTKFLFFLNAGLDEVQIGNSISEAQRIVLSRTLQLWMDEGKYENDKYDSGTKTKRAESPDEDEKLVLNAITTTQTPGMSDKDLLCRVLHPWSWSEERGWIEFKVNRAPTSL